VYVKLIGTNVFEQFDPADLCPASLACQPSEGHVSILVSAVL